MTEPPTPKNGQLLRPESKAYTSAAFAVAALANQAKNKAFGERAMRRARECSLYNSHASLRRIEKHAENAIEHFSRPARFQRVCEPWLFLANSLAYGARQPVFEASCMGHELPNRELYGERRMSFGGIVGFLGVFAKLEGASDAKVSTKTRENCRFFAELRSGRCPEKSDRQSDATVDFSEVLAGLARNRRARTGQFSEGGN